MEFGGPDHQPDSLYSAMKHAEYPLSIKPIGQSGTKRRSLSFRRPPVAERRVQLIPRAPGLCPRRWGANLTALSENVRPHDSAVNKTLSNGGGTFFYPPLRDVIEAARPHTPTATTV